MRITSFILVLSVWTQMASCNPSEEGGITEIPENPSHSGDGENNPGNNNENMKLKVTIGSTLFTATLSDNSTAKAFQELLPLTLQMSDFNNNEKVTSLPKSLPTNTYRPGIIHTGDIMLYSSSNIVIFYETFSSPYSYSQIGTIDNTESLKAAIGNGTITVTFELQAKN